MKKIVIFGSGYVGLSNAVLLSQQNKVVAVDINEEKVRLINSGKSPIVDKEIQDYLDRGDLNLVATTDGLSEVNDADFIAICTPTNYDPSTNYFDTSSVSAVIESVSRVKPNATFIIKSTIPVGFTKSLKEKGYNAIFIPEFLREGKALYDNLYPSRIVVGDDSERAKEFTSLLVSGAIKKDIPVLFTESTEAEAIKLFSNTYLAMRVSYFNELDSFCIAKNLNTEEIIRGVTLDPRIGEHYRNPSFGYGGYCLPKDTKQLLANYSDVPQTLIKATVESNNLRKEFISEIILKRKAPTVGIYRLVMKSGSDNFRDSAVQDIIEHLSSKGQKMVIYEPSLSVPNFNGVPIVNDLTKFKEISNLIVANRFNKDLLDVQEKVFSRDIFRNN
ncbi:nucleotide sugar dehydrogenase [uncultured Parasutterella sp.]|uniref:nucleotide sugar dehydrogenase n=1 Tax=uncultured Parasutterella sp. TaxID=1263098 RepID=UPI00260F97B2|nr:nucleotide sugar dehydrogenase [uncultured Parasutterella sp.]